jgi:hypothetical protein
MSYPPPPPGYQPPPWGYVPVPQQNQMAMWSMISGIVGIPLALCCSFVGIVPAIIALSLGIISRNQIRDSHGAQTGDGMALAGVITGAVGLVLGIGVILVNVVFMVVGASFD